MFKLDRCDCIHCIYLMHQQQMMIDEKELNKLKTINNIITLKKNDFEQEFVLISTAKHIAGQEARD